ncbi:hypothetical protein OOU_Y34scaffold00290g6 [Pyricularia oryzae Y34]|uniref:Uncharacterized protein n=3 Tax=Pyricularia oryzae TaxID=318829 RepID=A0A4P7NRD7_PYROR|nr:hypothetical protein OOU_Y34scaffold00290g6 [Pyricularia oryzae Y34]QBZ64366.1 hypothetical protein PoMZ_06062 [Pyricularia oryzae]
MDDGTSSGHLDFCGKEMPYHTIPHQNWGPGWGDQPSSCRR